MTSARAEQKWPDVIWLVRHGQSAGNVAWDEAMAARQHSFQVARRDMDVPLSELGEQQAWVLGQWFGQMPPDQRPTAILTSPYMRAQNTASLIAEAAGLDLDEVSFVVDERLREREFGILEGLTRYGIEANYPDQALFRRQLGKFYHRPPGGESWADVILRLRSVIDTLTRDYMRERVLIISHQVVVLCFRYLFERMTEEQILAIDRTEEVANCSVTTFEFDPSLGRRGKLVLRAFNFVAPLEAAGEPITREPDNPLQSNSA